MSKYIINTCLDQVRDKRYYLAYDLAEALYKDGNHYSRYGISRETVTVALQHYVAEELIRREPQEIDSRLKGLLGFGYTFDELGVNPQQRDHISLNAGVCDDRAMSGSLDDPIMQYHKLATLARRIDKEYTSFAETGTTIREVRRRFAQIMTAIMWYAGGHDDEEYALLINAEMNPQSPDKMPLVGQLTPEWCALPPDIFQEIVDKAIDACGAKVED